MSKFKKVLKKKELEVALSKHPLREIDEEVKKDYVKGLVFIAVEDENFSDDERNYITALMSNIGVDSALLSEFESFASDPDEDELLSFMDRLKAFDEDVKINFLIEAVVLAYKDGDFDASEKEMFNDYIEMLELEEKKDDIMYIATALVDKNIDLALSIYTAKKEFFLKFDYMFDMLDVDIEKEQKKIYETNWVEWRDFKYGGVLDNNMVAGHPVTVQQYCIYLNSTLINKTLKSISGTPKFDLDGEVMIEDVANSNLSYESNLFTYEDENKLAPIVGVSVLGINSYINYINQYSYLDNTMLLSLIGDGSKDIVLNSNCFGKPSGLREIFNHNELGLRFYEAENFGSSNNGHTKNATLPTIIDNSFTFRLMKIEEN